MSKEYDDSNRGALFKNDKKETDNHPDYKGNINADGTEYWLSAWIKKSKDGKTYMSLSLQPKNADAEPVRRQAVKGNQPPADDIPF